ncbi:MAG: DUF2530 domain-containing protein [Georgenia sp.]
MPDLHLFDRRADPPPARVNAVTLTVTGTLGWAVATIVVFVLIQAGRLPDRALDVCLAALTMGVVGIAWGYVHEYRASRRARRPTETTAPGTTTPGTTAPEANTEGWRHP